MAADPNPMKQDAPLNDFALPRPSDLTAARARRASGLSTFHLRILTSAIGLAFCAPHASAADLKAIADASNIAPTRPVRAGERLSDWLAQQRLPADAYPQGLSWQAPSEEATQAALKSTLRMHLLGSEFAYKAPVEARQRMSEWIATLPVTGRVPVSVPDGRFLETKRQQDPLLAADHRVVVPRRPTTVTVVTGDGSLCVVPHAAGLTARDYANACRTPGVTAQIDRVWIAQPDGKVESFGVAGWNAQAQGEPAPGAWIWAPTRGSGWDDGFAPSLINFLATQGPAPDQNASLPMARMVAAPVGSNGGKYSFGGSSNTGSTGGTGSTNSDMGSGLTSSFSQNPPLRDRQLTGNDYGGIGLLQNPTARMSPAGDFSLSYSRTYPFSNLNVTLQPLDWLEVSYRYSSVSESKYGPAIAGNQSYKDKSIDVKVRLLKESAYLPELAVGARDTLGTGLFSGEYFVANKRTGNFDWSLGLGWGQLGSRADFTNPLGVIATQFERRPTARQAGNVNLNVFRGPVALFGGVEAQTPWDPLLVKLEYEGNDYSGRVPFLPISRAPESRFNYGLVYRYSPTVDLSFSIQRGNRAAFSIALHNSLSQLAMPKIDDPVLPSFTPQRPEATGAAGPDWTPTAEAILFYTNWRVTEIAKRGEVVFVELGNADDIYWRDSIEKATAVVHRDAPPDVQQFRFQFRGRGALLADIAVDRNEWVKAQNQPLLPSEQVEQKLPALVPPVVVEPKLTQYREEEPSFIVNTGFRINQNFGGPDGFLLYALSVETDAEWRLNNSTWVSGSLNLRALDNYGKFDYTASSNLPRVRTFLREFNTTSRVTIPNLQLTHVGQLNTNQFYSIYGGYLESMYAGVGGEWLYRPFRSPLALGVDINAVRQRDFAQKLDLRDYDVKTGHLTAYWDTGWNDILATVSVGQYLAGDKGATLNLTKRFSNGVTMGAYATKTNVSAAQFGEGSFDKGIYFTIPLGAVLTKSTAARGVFAYNPLVRDGGAKLGRAYPLIDVTGIRDTQSMTTVVPKKYDLQ